MVRHEADGSAAMTPEQQQWADAIRAAAVHAAAKAPHPPTWGPRRLAFSVVRSRTFEMVVITVISANVVAMALDYYRMEEDEDVFAAYQCALLAFTIFYYAECAIKIVALGGHYFRSASDCFDFSLVCMSLLEQFAAEWLPITPTVLRVLRLFRVLRILRLVNILKGLRKLVLTLVLSLPCLINVGSLLGLVTFMFAVLGMNLFTYTIRGAAIDAHQNFERFDNALLLLFQCLTADGWSEFMDGPWRPFEPPTHI